MRRRLTILGVLAIGLGLTSGAALGQTFNSGSTGVDGALAPASSVTLTLPASGVFNFTTVNIPAGVTVRFTRNTTNTPVTLLASGNVTIAGTIDVGGAVGGNAVSTATSLAPNGGAGGPGGFDGGTGSNGIVSTTGGSGLGPGGGAGGLVTGLAGGGAGFALAGGNAPIGSAAGGIAYGTATLLPLIGGSGGAGGGAAFSRTAGGGGGGGGAVIIASSGTITLTGSFLARGGNGGNQTGQTGAGGGGSGGAVRLVATTITGTGGTISVSGGTGGIDTGFLFTAGGAGSLGRVRVEGFTNALTANFAGATPSVAAPTSVTLTNAPVLRIASVGGVAAPTAPSASFGSPDIALPATTTNPVLVSLEGTNIPPGTSVTVRVRGQVDADTSTTTTLAGSQTATSASASVTIPTNEPSIITASASFPLVASAGGGPIFAEGEEVERVRVTAGWGGATRVAYITKSGREIVVTPVR